MIVMPKKKYLCLAIIFTFVFISLSSQAMGSVLYNMSVEDGNLDVDAYYTLTNEENERWRTNVDLNLPENTVINYVTDGSDNISYTFEDESLTFETPIIRSDERTFKIDFEVNDVVSEKYEPLKKVELKLPGFEGKDTYGELYKDDLISWYDDLKYNSSLDDNELKFSGEGSLPLIFYFSEKGNTTENYHYFRDIESIEEIESLYGLVPEITGIRSPHDKYALLSLNDTEYNEKVNTWSDGVYDRGGLIIVRNSLDTHDFIATVIHETLHGYNSKILDWDNTHTAYYDEGMAKFIELLVYQKLDSPRPEIFGNRTEFQMDGDDYYFRPRGTPEDLYEIYEENKEWMYSWEPGAGNRRLGYAFSELIIRNVVLEEDIDGLRNVSLELNQIDRRITDVDEKYSLLDKHIDLEPCKEDDFDELRSCLNDINSIELNDLDLNLSDTSPEVIEDVEIDYDTNITDQKVEDQRNDFLNDLINTVNRWFEWILNRL